MPTIVHTITKMRQLMNILTTNVHYFIMHGPIDDDAFMICTIAMQRG